MSQIYGIITDIVKEVAKVTERARERNSNIYEER